MRTLSTLSGASIAIACLLATDTAKHEIAATPLARSAAPSASIRPGPAPSPSQPQEAETPRLPLTLLGTLAANEASLSRATIYDRESDRTLVVGIGDEIGGRALVVEIQPRRVVMRENGADQPFMLDATVASTFRNATSTPAAEHPDATSLLSQAFVMPQFEGSELVGLQVSAIRSGSVFERIGLEDGDVITGFDESAIDSQEKGAQLLQELSDSDAVHLVGYRADGSERVWDYVRGDRGSAVQTGVISH